MTTFFIGGCMRSGTSLLNSVLCSDTTTNPVIGEVQYLTQMMHTHAWGLKHFRLYLKDTFEDQEAFKAFTRGCLETYLDRTRARWQPCRHLVLKNPELVQYFPELPELVEDAKFFLTVRDPRDTIVSMLKVAQKHRDAGLYSALTRLNDDPRQSARFYKNYYFRFLRGDLNALGPSLFLLRYEDLVTQPTRIVEQIRAFSGLDLADFDPGSEWSRSAEDYDQRRRDPDLSAWTTELYGQGISDRQIGRYRDVLGADEVAIIEEECQAVMQLFKYDTAAARTSSA